MEETGRVLNCVKNIVIRNFNIELSVSKTGIHKFIQHMLAIKPSDPAVAKLYGILLENFILAEKSSPGAGRMFLAKFAGLNVEKEKMPMDKTGILKNFSFMKRSNFEMFRHALDLVDSASSIVIKKSSNANYYVEACEGFAFQAKCLINTKPQFFRNVIVVCVDGYIESVSEIHHVLTELSSNKTPCALFCRGMSEEVSHTIKVNNDRGSLSLFPYQISFDLDGANTMVDIATISGGDVISSLKGQLISTMNISTMKKVDSCGFYSHQVIIKNAASKKSSKILVNQLREKIEKNPELTETLQKRIRSLTSSCVEIALPDDMSFSTNSLEFDEAIRRINSIASNFAGPHQVADVYLSSFEEATKNLGVYTLE